MGNLERNRKVAKSRGKKWRDNIIKGRHEASKAPSALRLWRIGGSLSQGQMAGRLKLSTPTYAAMELGKRPVSEDRAKKVAAVAGKTLATLFVKKGDEYLVRR